MTTSFERPTAPYVAVMLTRRCNMTCGHCSVESGPRVRGQPSDERLLEVVDELADAGVSAVLFTGGEPMLRETLVLRLLRAARKRGMRSAIATNGFWAKTLPAARSKLRALRRAGLDRITLSYDRYHAKFQGPQPGMHLLRAAEELRVPMNVSITRVGDDPELSSIVAPFERSRHASLRFYDVQPVGRAKALDPESLRGQIGGTCNAAGIPAVTDDMRLTTCNGPAYFMRAESPLVLGSLDETPLAELLRRHRDDPILETIRTFGPERLRDELRAIPGFESFPFRQEYSGMCELCLDINSDPAAAQALRSRLADPLLAAEREARRHVIEGARERGEMGFAHANGVGVARLWLSGASAGSSGERRNVWGRDAERVFGRSDLDWQSAARYIAGCGMARVIEPLLDQPELSRWSPTVFGERVRRTALLEAKRELSQLEALRRIGSALTSLGGTGVLFKGAALLALARSEAQSSGEKRRLRARSAGDIDILVDSPLAGPLRSRLLMNGFTGDASAARTGPHHLAAISFRGVPVEIHTRIMPRFWRLPEGEMLSVVRPLDFEALSALDDEGMLLHALVHSTAHIYSHGLRTAWDVRWLLDRSSAMDWTRVARWADSTSMPAAFSLPAIVLRGDLKLDLPREILPSTAERRRLHSLERVAAVRFFSAMEGAFDLNPIVKNGFFLLLESRWSDRAAHLGSLVGRDERESRRSAACRAAVEGRARNGHPMAAKVTESLRQWRAYRRLARSAHLELNQAGESVFAD